MDEEPKTQTIHEPPKPKHKPNYKVIAIALTVLVILLIVALVIRANEVKDYKKSLEMCNNDTLNAAYQYGFVQSLNYTINRLYELSDNCQPIVINVSNKIRVLSTKECFEKG